MVEESVGFMAKRNTTMSNVMKRVEENSEAAEGCAQRAVCPVETPEESREKAVDGKAGEDEDVPWALKVRLG